MPAARGEISFSAVAQGERFKRLSAQLKDAGNGKLRRKLNNAVRREGAGALRAVQRAWLTVDVTGDPDRGGGGSTWLRSRVSAATRIQTLGAGIRVSVQSSRVDPRYGRSLVRGLDGLGRWRHPVYGNEQVWVGQRGEEVFYTTLRRFEPRWRRGIQQAMDDVAREITS